MAVPYYFLLIIYAVVVLAIFIVSLFNLYHAARFGMNAGAVRSVSLIFMAVSISLVIATMVSLRAVDWSQTFDVSTPAEVPSSLTI